MDLLIIMYGNLGEGSYPGFWVLSHSSGITRLSWNLNMHMGIDKFESRRSGEKQRDLSLLLSMSVKLDNSLVVES